MLTLMILNSRGSPKGLIDSREGRFELASSWHRNTLWDFILARMNGAQRGSAFA